MPSSIIGAVGSIAGGLISSKASSKAANQQQASADRAAELEKYIYDTGREDLAPYRSTGYAANDKLSALLGLNTFDRNAISQRLGLANTSPTQSQPLTQAEWLAQNPQQDQPAPPYGTSPSGAYSQYVSGFTPTSTGGNSASNNAAIDAEIARLQGDPSYGSLTKRFSMSDYTADPGYQFRQSEGEKALSRAQAARGGFYSGAALKAADRFNSDLASQEYGNAYSRFNTDQNNLYSRLAGVSDAGRGATNTGIQAGQNYASNVGSIYGQAANAQAGNAINQGNILSQGISGGLSALMGSQYGNSSGAGIDPRTGLPRSGYWS